MTTPSTNAAPAAPLTPPASHRPADIRAKLVELVAAGAIDNHETLVAKFGGAS